MNPEPRFTNRLAQETSPYLRQHAHNPVDWYPWGAEALQQARELDRPIFLSIGYSACHWCHVMEKESFENPEVGQVLNEHFVSIKVDREERPDLDQIYMTAVQIMTRQGRLADVGVSDARPEALLRRHLLSARRPLRPARLHAAHRRSWPRPGRTKRDVVEEQAGQLTEHVQAYLQLGAGQRQALDAGPAARRRRTRCGAAFDSHHGGFGSAPKFPHPMELRLLLRVCQALRR